MSSPSVPAGSQRGGGAFSVEMALQVLLSALLIGPAVIHAALAGTASQWTPATGFHAVLAIVDGVLAITVLMTFSRPIAITVVAVTLTAAVVYTLARATGLPFQPLHAVQTRGGIAGLVTTILEVASAALAIMWAWSPRSRSLTMRLQRPVAEGPFMVLLLVAAVAAAVLAYVGVLDSLTSG